jgi:hypothetical protein
MPYPQGINGASLLPFRYTYRELQAGVLQRSQYGKVIHSAFVDDMCCTRLCHFVQENPWTLYHAT